MRLRVLDHLPDGFLTASARDLIHILPEPTLFDLPGRNHTPLFVSVLLHGNEDTGLIAVQEVLRRHQDIPLPRRMLLFVGNVVAAAKGVRTLDDQLDFNRVWPGTPYAGTPEARLMQAVVDHVADERPFASIDIHNNTGLNPHYACINRLDAPYLHLARLFSRTVVYFLEPVGVQSAAMAEICPAVTVECGRHGEGAANDHAIEFIEAALALSEFPVHAPQPTDFDLLHTFAIVKVPADLSFSFDGSEADIRFRGDIDHLNFSEIPPGTPFGTLTGDRGARLIVVGDDSEETSGYFSYEDGKIRLARSAIPSMLTRDIRAVRLDCLCYLMHRIDFNGKQME